MGALPIVTFDSGFSNVERGVLHDCPVEFFTLAQMSFYQGVKAGWCRCPLGYATYAQFDVMGRKHVMPGIILPDGQGPKRKFPGHSIKFSKGQIEAYLKPHLAVSDEVKKQRDSEFKNLTHDLRAISTEIYHAALGLKREADDRSDANLSKRADSVMSAQQMMSLRLDIVDYESGHSAGRPKEALSVFKKVDKVVRCFADKLAHRRISLVVEGRSFGLTYGPPIFEIIPFVLIENAIKYAPNGSDIIVVFSETDQLIAVRFESLGPRIKGSEKELVFNQHFRGEAAKQSQKGGSGIGLFAAKTLLESQFGGQISVSQSEKDAVWYDGTYLHWTQFTIVLPQHASNDSLIPTRNRRGLFTLGRR